MLTLSQRLAFHFASRSRRHEALRTTAVVLAILLAYGVAGRLDYETELVMEAQMQTLRAQHAESVLADCLAGRARFMTADQKIGISCRPAEEISL